MSVRVGAPAERLVERIRDLPAIPGVAMRASELLNDAQTSAQEISVLLASDPGLASKVLSIANSAYYGLPQRIGTLTHAVVLLGFNTVRNVVFASSLMRSLQACVPPGSYDYRQFWRHSMACGAISRLIAKRMRLPDMEEYFLMGLLHDVGKIVLLGWRPDEVARVQERVRAGEVPDDAERDELGTTHSQVGAALLQRWQLPELHIDAVCNHHAPELARHPEGAAIVHVADILVRAILLDCGYREHPPELSDEAWRMTGLRPSDLPPLFAEAVELVRRTEAALYPASSES